MTERVLGRNPSFCPLVVDFQLADSEKTSLCSGHQQWYLVPAALANSCSVLALCLFSSEFPECVKSVN